MVAVGHDEEVDVGLHLAGKILEHQMLVLHLGTELGGLERASPSQTSVDRRGADRRGEDVRIQPFVEECEVVFYETISLVCSPAGCARVENVVNGGQADVLVSTAIAGDEMGVQQFVGVNRQPVAWVGEAIRGHRRPPVGNSIMGNVGEAALMRMAVATLTGASRCRR